MLCVNKNKKMYERILNQIESTSIKGDVYKIKLDLDSYLRKSKLIEDTINNMKSIFTEGNDYEFEEYCPDFDENDYDFDEILDFANEVINSLEIKKDGVDKIIKDTNSILITAKEEEKEMCEFIKNIISDLEKRSYIYDLKEVKVKKLTNEDIIRDIIENIDGDSITMKKIKDELKKIGVEIAKDVLKAIIDKINEDDDE